MNKVKEQIANFFTLLNLASGVMGIMFILHFNLEAACYCVFAGAVFDFFDGFVARALGIASEMGKQLDSLSDVVTFGVLPGLIAANLLAHSGISIFEGYTVYPPLSAPPQPIPSSGTSWLAYSFLLIPAFSALRLAKFNIDTKQSKNFRGLPTPPNGLFWAALGLIVAQNSDMVYANTSFSAIEPQSLAGVLAIRETVLLSSPGIVLFLIIATSLMLIMPISLFGFKFDKFTWKDNEMKFLLLIVAIPLVVIFKFAAAPIILLLYIIFSIIHFYILKKT